MTAHVHGEISADGASIVLMGLGPPEDQAELAQYLTQLTPLCKPIDGGGALTLLLSWPAVIQLSAILGPAWHAGPKLAAWTADQVARRLAPTTGGLTAPVPDGLTPRPYQVEGALIIAATGRAFIFDEPRTGKTITTVLGIAEWMMRSPGVYVLDQEGRTVAGDKPTHKLPVLVICPASVVDPWVEHFRRWAPYLTTVAWRGPAKRRHALAGAADVYVTSYDTTSADVLRHPSRAPLLALGAKAVIADEVHLIKTPHTSRSQAVVKLAERAEAFVALSGTPITHTPGDLHPALKCLVPGAYPNKERWANRYCLSVPKDYGVTVLGLNPHTEPEFRNAMLGQYRRAARADVMSQLPPKVYSTRTVHLPEAYRKAYDGVESAMLGELPDGQEVSVMDVLAQLTSLSALACAAADVEITFGPDLDSYGEPKRHQHLTLKAPSWKVDALLEILDERRGEQSVSFAVSAQLTRMAGAAAEKDGHRVGYIIGGQSPKDRTRTREAFQAGDLDLICATTGAGGVGITLSAAGTLIFLQRPWSLVESLQAEDRGEGDDTKPGTEIIDIIAANTIDSRVRAVLRQRAGSLAELVRDPRILTELLGGSRTKTLDAVAS